MNSDTSKTNVQTFKRFKMSIVLSLSSEQLFIALLIIHLSLSDQNNGVRSGRWEGTGVHWKEGAGLRFSSDCVIIWLGHTAALCKWVEQCTTMEINSSLVCRLKRKRMRSLPSGALQPTFSHHNEKKEKRQIGLHNKWGMRRNHGGAGKENRPHVCREKLGLFVRQDATELDCFI